MKNLSILIFSAFLMFSVIPGQLNATTMTNPITEPTITSSATEPIESEVATILHARIHEIHEMDLKGLTRSEKRALRQEVREINNELKNLDGGIYLSVGAILIIILLLILIL